MCTELLPPGGYPIAVKYIIPLTCLEFTGYRIKNSTVLWLPEFKIGNGPNV